MAHELDMKDRKKFLDIKENKMFDEFGRVTELRINLIRKKKDGS